MTSDNEIIRSNISEMSTALSKAEPALIQDFFVCLLTPSELDEVAKRWALVKEIASGTPQREIAKRLGLSLCKITRGSRELKKESSAFKRMLEIAGIEVPESLSRRRSPRREGAKGSDGAEKPIKA
jgi:TrpR family transcriptional regulator, trp operon repressor